MSDAANGRRSVHYERFLSFASDQSDSEDDEKERIDTGDTQEWDNQGENQGEPLKKALEIDVEQTEPKNFKQKIGNFPFASRRHHKTAQLYISSMATEMWCGTPTKAGAAKPGERLTLSRKSELHRRMRRDEHMNDRQKRRRSTVSSLGNQNYQVPHNDCAGFLADYAQRIAGTNFSLARMFEAMAHEKCYSHALRIARSEDTAVVLMQVVGGFLKSRNVPEFCNSVKDKLFEYSSEIVKLRRQGACLKDEVVAWSMSYRLRHYTVPKQPLTSDDAWNEQVQKFWKLYHQLFEEVPLAKLTHTASDAVPFANLKNTSASRAKTHSNLVSQSQISARPLSYGPSQVLWKNRAGRTLEKALPARPRSATGLRADYSTSKPRPDPAPTGRSQSVGELRRRIDEESNSKTPMRALMRTRRPQSTPQLLARPRTATLGRQRSLANISSAASQPEALAFSRRSLALDITLKPSEGLTEQNVCNWEVIADQTDALQDESELRVDALESFMSHRSKWKTTTSMLALSTTTESGAFNSSLPKPGKFEAGLLAHDDFVERRKLAATAIGKDENMPMRWYAQFCLNQGLLPSPNPFVIGYSPKITVGPKTFYDGDLDAIISMVNYTSRIDEIDLEGSSFFTEKKIHEFVQSLIDVEAIACTRKINFKSVRNFGLNPQQALVQLIKSPGTSSLKSIDLSDVQVGIALHPLLCEAIGRHPLLEDVALASTGFGCGADLKRCIEHLLQSTTLKSLDLSWNLFTADAFSHLGDQISRNSILKRLILANCSSAKEVCDITPMVFFLECLAYDTSLTYLDVSMNRIDFRGALVIEDVLDLHRKLKELNLSQNPLGTLGTRSLLRLLLRDDSGLTAFDLTGCSYGASSEVSPSAKVYSPINPGGRYQLDLSSPQDRSMLRMMYKTCERFNLSPSEAFVGLKSDQAYFQHHPKGSDGLWPVAREGKVAMTFSIDRALERAYKDLNEFRFGDFLTRHMTFTRLRPGFRKVIPLVGLWKRIEGQYHEQLSLLQALSKDFALTFPLVQEMCESELSIEVINHLFPCVLNSRAARYLMTLTAPTIVDCVGLLDRLHGLLFLNPEHPTGHYHLRLHKSIDHTVAEMLMLLDRWELGIDNRQQQLDASQRGDGSHMRNVEHFGKKLHCSVFEWQLPTQEELEFDYVSSRRPSESGDTTVIDDETLKQVLLTLQRSGLDHFGIIEALRMVSHLFCWTSFQARQLLGVCGSGDAVKCEVFVLMFFRIIDIQNEKVFRIQFDSHRAMFQKLQNRLGHATLFPFIQPEQFAFHFDLSVHDQRITAYTLLVLAFKESPDNLREFEYFHDGFVDPLLQGLPRSWLIYKNVPHQGTWSGHYECSVEHRKFGLRQQSLANYGKRKLAIKDSDVIWWSSVAQLPPDVLEFVEFLIPRFHTMTAAFQVLAGDATRMSKDEFLYGVLNVLKCSKFKGPDEEKRVIAIFRYLDPGAEGTISVEEWKVLEQIFEEIKLSMREFVEFLERTFCADDGEIDWDGAWEVLDEDESGEIDRQEWGTACTRLGFFGNIWPIFNFVDKDGEGTISQDEFFELQKFNR